MVLDGAARDVECLANLAIGSAASQQGEDLLLPLGQLRQVAYTGKCRMSRCGHRGFYEGVKHRSGTTSGCKRNPPFLPAPTVGRAALRLRALTVPLD